MEGFTDVQDMHKLVKIGNYKTMRATKSETLSCGVTQLDRKKCLVTLRDVKYIADLCTNLFSLNKAIKKGFKVSNDSIIVSLTNNHVKLTFTG